jgi:hypothetical protein
MSEGDYAMLSLARDRMSAHKIWPFRLSAWVIARVLFTSILSAQFLTEALPDQDIGRPPQPPFITFLGIVMPGKLVTDPSLPPVGPVAQTIYEELRPSVTPAGPAGEVMTSITDTWDEAGRLIEEIRKDGGSESDTINRYVGARLVSQETTFPQSRQPAPKAWSYWVYDPSGKLTEYRRGRADRIQNHDTNFKRDSQGRLTSYEYRQGPKDELSSRTELRYSNDGKTVDITHYDMADAIVRSTTQSVDGQGHVVTAVIRDRDWRTKQMKTPLKVSFRYDERGRLIEQDTDAHEFDKSGSEQEIPPGKISIAYDDVKNTKTTSYSGDEGSLVLTVTRNALGATIKFTGGTAGAPLDSVIDCAYDSHGNWTTCRQTSGKPPAVGNVAKMWRRTITYR